MAEGLVLNKCSQAGFAIVATLILLCAGCAVLKHAADPPAKTVLPVKKALPAHVGSYLGVYEPEGPGSYRQVENFGRNVGYHPDIVLYFSGWGELFKRAFAATAWAHGATALVQINPDGVSLAKLAKGDYDTYLARYADQVRAFSHPVIIGFAHEMNGNWYSWGGATVSAATWIAAWRHLVVIFRQQGADNVTWLWTINRISSAAARPRKWWPGAGYVTWVGVDGYYDSSRRTYPEVFGATVAAVRKLTSMPILLAETATYPGATSQISGLFGGIRRDHLLGLVWYDAANRRDWRLEGHPGELTIFHEELAKYHIVP